MRLEFQCTIQSRRSVGAAQWSDRRDGGVLVIDWLDASLPTLELELRHLQGRSWWFWNVRGGATIAWVHAGEA